ncbi:MAG: gamma-glutamylcyclotransferase [Gammaproteobacteria bacterium]|nr:gamma-glutamylcyclotransferase [Gammaproteobacteria bacterium]
MRYAAYGSNLHPLRLSARIASAKFITTAFLPGRSLHFHKRSKDGSGKCNIVSGSEGVHVAVYDVSTEDKKILDKIEGVGMGYLQRELDVPDVGLCASYVAAATHVDNSLLPYDWYRELVLLGARAQRFPEAYIDAIAAIPCREDPDVGRRDMNNRTIETIRRHQLP